MPDIASPRATGRRTVAERNRMAIIDAAVRLLRVHSTVTMQAVATAAGVSRSTLYRNVASPDELQQEIRAETLRRVEVTAAAATTRHRPVLAAIRHLVTGLVEVGRHYPIDLPAGPPPDEQLAEVAGVLEPLAQRLSDAAGLEASSSRSWRLAAIAHFIGACLRAGWHDPDGGTATVTRLFERLTDPLDRGLLLTDADGVIVAANADGRLFLESGQPGQPVVVQDGGTYEDGSPAPADLHPLALALARSSSTHGVRAVRAENGTRWLSIGVHVLRRSADAEPYGFVAVLADVTEEHRVQRRGLQPAGTLTGTDIPVLDIVRVLDEVPPPLLPEQLVAEATRLAGGPVALYVLDIDGTHLLRLAGTPEFPDRMRAPLSLGPELAPDGLPGLRDRLAEELPGVVMAPMWLRGRAVGLLLARRGSEVGLREIAQLGAAAMELAGGYTDVFDDARRRKDMTPSAEIQQSLLPPRIVRVGGAELAGGVLPSYEVGGDWFDYVENPDGTWIAIADGAGRGPRAAGLASVTLAALRAARRNHETLEQAATLMDQTVADAGGPEFFVTAILARWSPVHSIVSWINLGHPPPLLLGADGATAELPGPPDPPLGITEHRRPFRRHQRALRSGDRLVFYTDGISRRRTADGAFDVDGIAAAARNAEGSTAAAAARGIQEAVVDASEDPLPDDAAVVVLAIT